jgi:hypothetical protein
MTSLFRAVTLGAMLLSTAAQSQDAAMLTRGPRAGTSAWADYLLEHSPGDLARLLYSAGPAGRTSGIYEYNVSSYVGISTRVGRGDDPPNWNGTKDGDAPRSALSTLVTNTGSLKAADGFLSLSHCAAAGTSCFGGNPIALTTDRSGSVKLIGLEIDVMWPTGTRVTDAHGSGGLMINVFNTNHGGPAIQLGAVGAGAGWDNGMAVAGVSGAGLFVEGGAPFAPDALLDSRLHGKLRFGTAAVRLGNDDGQNNQRLLLEGAQGKPATLSLDRTDSLNLSSPRRVALATAAVERFTLDAQGIAFIANANGPPTNNPSGGGYLYVENGALKYRGASGRITTLAER